MLVPVLQSLDRPLTARHSPPARPPASAELLVALPDAPWAYPPNPRAYATDAIQQILPKHLPCSSASVRPAALPHATWGYLSSQPMPGQQAPSQTHTS